MFARHFVGAALVAARTALHAIRSPLPTSFPRRRESKQSRQMSCRATGDSLSVGLNAEGVAEGRHMGLPLR